MAELWTVFRYATWDGPVRARRDAGRHAAESQRDVEFTHFGGAAFFDQSPGEMAIASGVDFNRFARPVCRHYSS